jgi:hypothetical protein
VGDRGGTEWETGEGQRGRQGRNRVGDRGGTEWETGEGQSGRQGTDGRTTHQKGLVELKQAGELLDELVHTVQPLQEHRALLADVVRVLLVAAAVPELMAVVQPLRLHQHLEPLRRETHGLAINTRSDPPWGVPVSHSVFQAQRI